MLCRHYCNALSGETVVVGICTLLVIPTSYIEAIYFSEKDPVGRDRFRPAIDMTYDQR